jgi:integrase
MVVRKQWSSKFNREVWGYDARINGRRLQKFGFASKSAAEIALSQARITAFERQAGVAPPPERATVTVRALVERRAAQLQRKAAISTLKRWRDTLPAGLLVTDLTTAHLQNYQDARLTQVKPQTVFREITDICSALNSARDRHPELEDWQPPRRPRLKTPTRGRDRIISRDEAARVLAHLRRPREEDESERYWRVRIDAADLFQIALLTAARRMEILSLRWSDVNFEWQTLRIIGTKTDRVRVVPMGGPLNALLRRRRAEAGNSPRVFPALAGSTMLRANTDQIFRAACKEINIPYGRDVEDGWVLHDARHTAITAMLHAGNSLESVMAISGHSARVMTMRYAHSTEQTRRA